MNVEWKKELQILGAGKEEKVMLSCENNAQITHKYRLAVPDIPFRIGSEREKKIRTIKDLVAKNSKYM